MKVIKGKPSTPTPIDLKKVKAGSVIRFVNSKDLYLVGTNENTHNVVISSTPFYDRKILINLVSGNISAPLSSTRVILVKVECKNFGDIG